MDTAGKLHVIFHKITGKKLDMGLYENRLTIQKLIYLLQASGINYKYYFSWYMKGPYSAKLTKQCFDEMEPKSDIALEKIEEEIIQCIKENFSGEIKDMKKLELLGSVAFIMKNMGLMERNAAVDRLISLKPWCDRAEAEVMFEKIMKSEMLN